MKRKEILAAFARQGTPRAQGTDPIDYGSAPLDVDDGPGREPVQVAFGSATALSAGVVLIVRRTTTTLLTWATSAGDPSGFPVDVADLPRGRWVHVTLSIDLAQGAATASLAYDGASAHPGAIRVAGVDASAIENVNLRVGQLNPSSYPTAFLAAVDNVLADVK